jgi:WD40 repeat protein
VGRLAVSPRGDWLAAGCIDGTIRIRDPVTGAHRGDLQGHDNWIGPAVPAPDGSRTTGTRSRRCASTPR